MSIILIDFRGDSSERKFIQKKTDRVVGSGVEYGDIVVLKRRNADINGMARELRDAGVPCINLYDPWVAERRGVCVGTFKREKELKKTV